MSPLDAATRRLTSALATSSTTVFASSATLVTVAVAAAAVAVAAAAVAVAAAFSSPSAAFSTLSTCFRVRLLVRSRCGEAGGASVGVRVDAGAVLDGGLGYA